MSECEYHELTAEQTLAVIVEALDSYVLMDYIEAAMTNSEEDNIAWALLVSAMCRAREIVRETMPTG